MLLSVIVPVYNEEKTIRKLVERVRNVKIPKEIILVNDGSRDSSGAILDDIKSAHVSEPFCVNIIVIHKKNGGKGSALKEGICAATGDFVVFQDADLEYNPEDYHALLEPIVQGRADVTMGSRTMIKENIWKGGKKYLTYLRSHVGVRVMTILTNWLYWQNASDYWGCYKVFRAGILKSIPVEADGFPFDNELICKLLRRGQRIVEVPISYAPRGYDEGKKVKLRDGLESLWAIIKWRFAPFE